MSPSDLAELFEDNPNSAFRLTLSSGDTVDVLSPGRTLVGSSQVFIPRFDDANARIFSGSRYISVVNIAMVEQIDPRAPRGRRRRK